VAHVLLEEAHLHEGVDQEEGDLVEVCQQHLVEVVVSEVEVLVEDVQVGEAP